MKNNNRLKQINDFFQSLSEAELERLRICPICQKIFWAYRITSTGCCKQHSTAMRTRQWREGKKGE